MGRYSTINTKTKVPLPTLERVLPSLLELERARLNKHQNYLRCPRVASFFLNIKKKISLIYYT